MRILRLFVGVCLLLGVRSLGIAWTTLDELELYRETKAAGPWPVRVGVNVAFGFGFLVIAWNLRRRKAWAYRILLPALAVYVLFNFIWLAAYAQAAFDRERLGFVAVTSLVVMGLALWFWTRLQNMFGDDNEGQH